MRYSNCSNCCCIYFSDDDDLFVFISAMMSMYVCIFIDYNVSNPSTPLFAPAPATQMPYSPTTFIPVDYTTLPQPTTYVMVPSPTGQVAFQPHYVPYAAYAQAQTPSPQLLCIHWLLCITTSNNNSSSSNNMQQLLSSSSSSNKVQPTTTLSAQNRKFSGGARKLAKLHSEY